MPVSGTYDDKRKYKREISRYIYHMRKREGVCASCGREIDDESTSLYRCSRCMDIQKEYNSRDDVKIRKREREKRRNDLCYAFGVCPKCNKRDAVKDRHLCHICAEKARQRYYRNREKCGHIPRELLGNGYYCRICAKPVEKAGNKLCNRCYDKSVETLNANRHKARSGACDSINKLWKVMRNGR